MMPACPLCTLEDVLEHPTAYECLTCGHDWEKQAVAEEEAEPVERIVKDAHGNVLQNGDIVAMVKDLKLKGTSKVLKSGMKSKRIRLVDGDHEIDCKMDGLSIALKAQFVKKVQ
jgi:protein PhnA